VHRSQALLHVAARTFPLVAIPLVASVAWAQPAGAPPPPAPSGPPNAWFPPPAAAAPPAPATPPAAQAPAAQPPVAQPPVMQPPPPPPQGAAPPLPPPPPREFPARLRWDEGDPIPAGYEPTSRPRVGLLIAGAVVFGVAYVPSLGIAAGDDDTEYLPLAIPIVGPFVAIATTEAQDAGAFWLGVDGVTQVAGATMFIASFVAQQTSLKKSPTPLIGTFGGPRADLDVGPGSMSMKGAF